jgi:hypothetical protein
MEIQTMVKRRLQRFPSWLKIWGIWMMASRLVGHRVKQPLGRKLTIEIKNSSCLFGGQRESVGTLILTIKTQKLEIFYF